ncbi:MAG: hypothetical protein FJ149_01480 [Euryarchaeota archaeon]|nr:hypothetical protein [Euryarchaeota archaeon]
MPEECQVCRKPPISARHSYCARCHKWCSVRKEIRARVKTLKARYDPARDIFTCTYLNIPLNETDQDAPDALTFHHPIPKKRGKIKVSCSFYNAMISDLTDTEARRAVLALARRFQQGTAVDRKALRFRYWNRAPIKPPRIAGVPPFRAWRADECPICEKPPVPNTLYCARCHKMADAPDFSMVKLQALKEAYDPATDSFRCHYTGVAVDIQNLGRPWDLTYDHPMPGDGSRLVVAAYWVNVMKTQLSEDEFRAVVIEMARCFGTGEPFRMEVCEFRHWRKKA